ncbi:hypothetical protein PI124_g23382 [Phytophthora idaei]|nr:hypothetical protein PI126_g23302 [Phytophthora idaei]KAG3231521.1 hypothetical protein PI124_g23382 [Phytophthora idaei]
MDTEAVAVTAVLLSACTAATVDKRRCRRPPAAVSTFPTTTFEDAMAAPSTDWFHKKLRCDRVSFLLMYRDFHDACKRKPAANSKRPLVKQFALTILYLAQGGTMDKAATVLGVSCPRAVVYIK